MTATPEQCQQFNAMEATMINYSILEGKKDRPLLVHERTVRPEGVEEEGRLDIDLVWPNMDNINNNGDNDNDENCNHHYANANDNDKIWQH